MSLRNYLTIALSLVFSVAFDQKMKDAWGELPIASGGLIWKGNCLIGSSE